MDAKKLNVVLAVIILALIVIGGYIFSIKKGSDDVASAPEISNSNSINTNTPATNAAVNSQTNSAAKEDALVYTNTKYGFRITFPKVWEGYTTHDLNNKDGVGVIGFCMPTTSKVLFDTDCGSGKGSKLGTPLKVEVYTPVQWESIQKQDGPKPSLLGKNAYYVFGWDAWQDPPEDYQNTNLGFGAIVDSFRPL